MTLLEVPKITAPRPIWLKEHEKCDEVFTPQDVIYTSSILGKVRITVCTCCGYEDWECLHIYNNVNIPEKTIKCLLCGG